MAKQGTPVKRIVLDESGIGSVEARIPGVHYPSSKGPGDEGFVGDLILPGAHVGDSILPDVPPMNFGAGGGVEGLFGNSDGAGAADDQNSSEGTEP